MTRIICYIAYLVQVTHIEADQLVIVPVGKAGHPVQSNVVTYNLNHNISNNPWTYA